LAVTEDIFVDTRPAARIGKDRLGSIAKQGNRYLRCLLIVGQCRDYVGSVHSELSPPTSNTAVEATADHRKDLQTTLRNSYGPMKSTSSPAFHAAGWLGPL
jgi:hypothetical protein